MRSCSIHVQTVHVSKIHSVCMCWPYSWVWAHTHTCTHPHKHTNTHTHPLWKHYKPVFGAGLNCSQQLINPTSGPSQPKYLCPALYTTLHLSHCMWAVVVVSLPEAVGQQPYLCCRCNSLWILFSVRHCWCFCANHPFRLRRRRTLLLLRRLLILLMLLNLVILVNIVVQRALLKDILIH